MLHHFQPPWIPPQEQTVVTCCGSERGFWVQAETHSTFISRSFDSGVVPPSHWKWWDDSNWPPVAKMTGGPLRSVPALLFKNLLARDFDLHLASLSSANTFKDRWRWINPSSRLIIWESAGGARGTPSQQWKGTAKRQHRCLLSSPLIRFQTFSFPSCWYCKNVAWQHGNGGKKNLQKH